MHHILIVDDDQTMLRGIELNLEDYKNYKISTASDKKMAVNLIKEKEFDLVLSDLMVPETRDGLEIVKSARAQWYQPSILVMTAFETVENAISTMKAGADDFIAKGFSLDELSFRIDTLLKNKKKIEQLEFENRILKETIQQQFSDYKIVGESSAIKKLKGKLKKIAADGKSTCLIHGESGTGKDLVARNIHMMSPRHKEPFVPINCAAIPENLIESEFFGHEKGTFTGAYSTRQGKFEIARNGIIFLDEIAELPLPLQVRLLRVLEEKSFYRIGGKVPVDVDVMILAATNRDLKQLVRNGAFREDLYFRLNVINVEVAPLRDRKEDIPLLVKFFMDKFNRERKRDIKISREAMQLMKKYQFFGNVRELRNVIEDAFVLCENNKIDVKDLSINKSAYESLGSSKEEDSLYPNPNTDRKLTFRKALKRFEKKYFERLMELNDWRINTAAEEAGITREWLSKKIKLMGIGKT